LSLAPDIHRFGMHFLKGAILILLCLLNFECARGQQTDRQRQLITLSGKEVSRMALGQNPLEYPALARLNFIQGRVRVQIFVTSSGRVLRAHVISGNPLLAASALKSVHEWSFRPFVSEGSPVPFTTTLDIDFALHLRALEVPPPQAESDFSRQIKPPEVLKGPQALTQSSVRMRLLVNAEGKVIDMEMRNGLPSQFGEASRSIEQWAFRPARWGTLPVPWYLDVDVPVQTPYKQASDRPTTVE